MYGIFLMNSLQFRVFVLQSQKPIWGNHMWFSVVFVLLPILLVLPAYAETEVFVRPDNNQKILFPLTKNGYQADELLSTEMPIHIRLDRIPVKIEMRAVYQGAVGEDGPWANVPHTMYAKEWTPLPPRQEFDILTENEYTTVKIHWPTQFDCKHPDTVLNPDECVRWTDIYEKCQLDLKNGPCYVYQSAIELKVSYEKMTTPEIIRVNFPGGC
jgi:hypothetical protein